MKTSTRPRKKDRKSAQQKRQTDRIMVTREDVAERMLERIFNGEYNPGDRLPTQANLRPTFSQNLSMSTLNLGLRILRDMGFLNIYPQSSTNVADPLPYRNRIAITFPHLPDTKHPTTLYAVIHHVAMQRQQERGDLEYALFYGTNEAARREETLQALAEDIRWHRVSGILFASEIRQAPDDRILHAPRIPRACLSGWTPTVMPPMPHVTLGTDQKRAFMPRALDYLEARGCRDIAVFAYHRHSLDMDVSDRQSFWKEWQQEITSRGLRTRPYWLLPIDGTGFETAQLLMQGRERPDAIVVSDDILTAPVTAGLREAGEPYPAVVSMVNYPVLPRTHVPTELLGYDIESVFDKCVASLHDPNAQRTPPTFEHPAVFEHEWRGG